MNTARQKVLDLISNAIGPRRLLWVGTRGTDAQPLLQFEQFAGVFGLIAPLGVPSWPAENEWVIERLNRQRVDLDSYDIDADRSASINEVHAQLRKAMLPGTVVVAYRPTAFLSAACYPRLENVTYLGGFHGLQSAFEHKPWVETELRARGVPTIPWNYFSLSDPGVMREWMTGRSCVLRANYSDGGAGLWLARPGDNPERLLRDCAGGFLAMAPFLDPNIPLNVSACVFRDGLVTVRHPSVQLIGIPACTTRRFGYCGNDFASVAQALSTGELDRLEAIARHTGEWLGERGYVGAFGIDALLHEGEVLLTEINPRFQGSSAAAAMMAREFDEPDVYLDHLAAWLGLPAPCQIPLARQATLQAEPGSRLTQIVCHNTGQPQRLRPGAIVSDLSYGDLRGVPEDGVVVCPEAMLFKLFVRDAVLDPDAGMPAWLRSEIERLTGEMFTAASPGEERGEVAA